MNYKIILKKQFWVATLFLVVALLMKYWGITDYLSLAYLYDNLPSVRVYVDQHYYYSVVIFMMFFLSATMLSLPGCSFFLTAAGLLFGIIPGVFYSAIAATLGATVLFLTSRYVVGDWVQRRFHRQLERFNREMAEFGYFYLLLVRFLAIIPFFMINLFSGLTLVSTKTFMVTTFIGVIPTALVFGYAGKQLSYLDSFETIFCPPVLFAFGLLIFFKVLLLPFVYKFYRKRTA